ncbi:hypothetical protein ACGFJC_47330 [Nonomuraea fuscirosea]
MDLGFGYLDLTLFTIADIDIGFRAPWWAIFLAFNALLIALITVIRTVRR